MREVVQEIQMLSTVYLSLQPSSHEIWACPDNTATPLIQPIILSIGDHINGVLLYKNIEI